jgi:hypothetical protein
MDKLGFDVDTEDEDRKRRTDVKEDHVHERRVQLFKATA